MVIGDLGLLEMADPHVRLQKKLRFSEDNIDVCTPKYKPPDVCLGNRHYGEDLDMWAFGLVAAEIYSKEVLIVPEAQSPVTYFEAIAKMVPSSNNWPLHSCPASWLEGLPFFKKWYRRSGKDWLRAQARTPKPWPPLRLEGCPEGLAQLITNCLVWHPSARMTATEAKKASSCSRLVT